MRMLLTAVVVAVIAALMGTIFVGFQKNDSQTGARLSLTQLRAQGRAGSPYEETQYLGRFPLISSSVWNLGNVRRVTFQANGGQHHEALVTCDHPRIEYRHVYIYARISRVVWDMRKHQWQTTYYVVCAETPTDNTRREGSGCFFIFPNPSTYISIRPTHAFLRILFL